MPRVGATFVMLCMVLIAGSFGAALFLGLGFSAFEAMIAGLVALSGLALTNAINRRRRDGRQSGDQIDELSRGTGDLARQVAELGRRLATIESRGDTTADRAREAVAPLSAEIGELGTLVRQLAETLAAHETRIATIAARPAPPPPASLESASAQAFRDSEHGSNESAIGRLAAVGQDAMVATIRAAIDANRVDLYLQPIVTLPQRKVRYYEAFTRLRTEDGQMLLPADFLVPADKAGLLSRIDNLLLFRSVQVVRRLLLKNRDVGLFCNLSTAMLNDPTLFPQLLEFMEANRALAPSLVLEMRQSAWRAMGPMEHESIAALRDLGFRFCMDQVEDLRIEPKELGERGIRFVKVSAGALTGEDRPGGGDIHPADLSDLLGRYGISLIADRIENESQVVNLLDFELRFGQGFLFSPPRPVRQEALGQAEATPPADAPARASSLRAAIAVRDGDLRSPARATGR